MTTAIFGDVSGCENQRRFANCTDGKSCFVGQVGNPRRVGNPPADASVEAGRAECHSAAGCHPAPQNPIERQCGFGPGDSR
jgi:hypothetical protein